MRHGIGIVEGQPYRLARGDVEDGLIKHQISRRGDRDRSGVGNRFAVGIRVGS